MNETMNAVLTVYSTIIGLGLAAYAIMVTMLPHFTSESLRQPIFAQANARPCF